MIPPPPPGALLLLLPPEPELPDLPSTNPFNLSIRPPLDLPSLAPGLEGVAGFPAAPDFEGVFVVGLPLVLPAAPSSSSLGFAAEGLEVDGLVAAFGVDSLGVVFGVVINGSSLGTLAPTEEALMARLWTGIGADAVECDR